MTTGWFDDDAFWEKMRTVVFRRERMDAAPDEVTRIMQRLGLVSAAPGEHGFPGDAILDMPCGVGRHAIEFAKLGCVVTGVDRYQPYLDQAAQAARDAGVQLELVQSDMREFVREEAFDAAISMYTSFGYFDSHDDEMQTLRNYFRSLKPNGQLLMEMMSKEAIAMNFRPRDWFPVDADDPQAGIVLEERETVDHWRRLRTRWIYFHNGERFERTSNIRLFSAGELIMMLERAGFVDCEAFGTLDGTPYDTTAKRLIVKARKPG